MKGITRFVHYDETSSNFIFNIVNQNVLEQFVSYTYINLGANVLIHHALQSNIKLGHPYENTKLYGETYNVEEMYYCIALSCGHTQCEEKI